MKLLLDTHILLWMLEDSRRLSKSARSLLKRADSVNASAASAWEIAIKAGLGRIRVDLDRLLEAIEGSGIQWLDVRAEHALLVGKLPAIHSDPFDRLLVAQAVVSQMTLVTHDEEVAKYPNTVFA